MKSKITVLVTGVGGCGVGEGIAKALLMCAGKYRVVACNMHGDAPILFRVDAAYLVPSATDPGYLDDILSLCNREKAQVLIPGSEAELPVLAAERDALTQAGVHLIANPIGVLDIADDKWLTHNFLIENSFGSPVSALVPVSEEFWNLTTFPVVVKPRSGHGSKNVFFAHSKAELDILLSYFALNRLSPIVQELVGKADAEYTVSALIGRDGDVLGSIAMRRQLLGGFSQRVEIEDFADLRQEAEQIAIRLGARGPVNLQCRFIDGQYKIFEINARFSGTTPFRAMAGFNEVDILIQNGLFGTVPGSLSTRMGLIGLRGLEEVLVERNDYQNLESARFAGHTYARQLESASILSSPFENS